MPADPFLIAPVLAGAAVWSALHAAGRRRGSVPGTIGRARWPGVALRRGAAPAPATLDRDLLEIAAGLQAGLDFDGAVAGLAGKPPWSDYAGQRRAGVPAEEAAAVSLRPVWPELATVLAVHWRYGGPLADMLLMMADGIMRERQLAAELRARSSEARATAMLLALMGPSLGLYMLVREPQLLAPLLTEPVGLVALLGAGALWMAGLIVVRRLLRQLA